MKDENDDCAVVAAVIVITCCGSWLKVVDSEDDCDWVVVAESCMKLDLSLCTRREMATVSM